MSAENIRLRRSVIADGSEIDGTFAVPTNEDAPLSGQVPFAIGQSSVLRIPIPGTNGLCIEFRARGKVPASGSTSLSEAGFSSRHRGSHANASMCRTALPKPAGSLPTLCSD